MAEDLKASLQIVKEYLSTFRNLGSPSPEVEKHINVVKDFISSLELAKKLFLLAGGALLFSLMLFGGAVIFHDTEFFGGNTAMHWTIEIGLVLMSMAVAAGAPIVFILSEKKKENVAASYGIDSDSFGKVFSDAKEAMRKIVPQKNIIESLLGLIFR